MGKWTGLILVSLVVVAACGGPAPSNSGFNPSRFQDFSPPSPAPVPAPIETFPVPKKPKDQSEYLRTFPLLNRLEEDAPQKEKQFSGFPLGAVVGLSSSGQGSLCSASHLGEGYVATNAHCIGEAGFEYHVIFYGNDEKKYAYPVEDLAYVGNTSADDVAILRISEEAATLWASAGIETKEVPTSAPNPITGKKVPVAIKATVWSFDPLSAHPALRARVGRTGMLYRPRHCLLSRITPKVVGVQNENGEETRTNIRSQNAKDSMHLYLDNCDIDPIKGNSGSLITHKNAFGWKLGVFHWGVGKPTTTGPFNYFEYTGNDFTMRKIRSIDLDGGKEFFGVGYAFAHYLDSSQGPKIFTSFPGNDSR